MFSFTKNQARVANLAIWVGFVILALTLNPGFKTDGFDRYHLIIHLLKGEPMTEKYTLFMPLLALPQYVVLRLTGLNAREYLPYFNLLLTVAAGSYVYQLVKQRHSKTVAQISALVMLATGMYAHHLNWFFSEISTAFLIVIGYYLLETKPKISAVLFALSIWATPALAPVIAAAAAVQWFRSKFKNWQLVVSTVLGVCLILADNFVKYHQFSSPYLRENGGSEFTIPTIAVILSALFSWGKGVVWFLPGLLLFARKDLRNKLIESKNQAWMLAVGSLAFLLTYTAWWSWYAGWFWGPRFYFVFGYPAAIAIAVALTTASKRWLSKASTIAVVAFSTWVAIEGYLFSQKFIQFCLPNVEPKIPNEICWYTFEYSPLFSPFFGDGIFENFLQVDNPQKLFFAAWQLVVISSLLIWWLRQNRKAKVRA